jgi:Domain of unknown function (DUF4276)
LIEVIVVGEGQTEESFVNDVLVPRLSHQEVFLSARLIRTSPVSRGGALSWDRVRRFLRNTLRERSTTYVTTFFDLYRLDAAFPGTADAGEIADPLARAAHLERCLHAAVVAEAGCRPERFLPHIQPHEFEALVFTNVDALAEVEPQWQADVEACRRARTAAKSPEHINDGAETHPSARLRVLRPSYDKVLHGVALAERIGLDRIRAECAHFAAWMSRLEALEPLVPPTPASPSP